MTELPMSRPWVLVLLGSGVGVLSGLFGIGGGVVLMPALALLLRMQLRTAAGTSVAAVLPAAVAGAGGYALQGQVVWLAGLLLAAGMVLGAQAGSYLLSRIPQRLLRWLFSVFMVLVVVSLWFSAPQRSDSLEIDVLLGVLLAVVGGAVGVLSGLLGIGGGVIVVPVLMFVFGANDLQAKGTSLLMLVPGALSGTVANAVRRLVDFRIAAWVGVSAAVFSPPGAWIASLLEPRWSNIAFSALVVAILVQMALRGRRSSP